MLFNYHLVFGALEGHRLNFDQVNRIFSKEFDLIQLTSTFYGPSESVNENYYYFNYGVTIQSDIDWASLKLKIKLFEQRSQFFNQLDIDILVQEFSDTVYLISPKVLQFTHSLKVLNDLSPNLLINNLSVNVLSSQKKNFDQFSLCL